LKCAVCDRKSGAEKYCRLHEKAYENIVKSYAQWRKALKISWKEYLSQIANNPLTGEWAKEVAKHLMKSGERTDVKNG
jgi:hypothetical protein